jgi:transposase
LKEYIEINKDTEDHENITVDQQQLEASFEGEKPISRSKLNRLSVEERMQVIISVATGHSQRRVAKTHGIAPSTVATIIKRYREEKRIGLKPPPGRPKFSMPDDVTEFIVRKQAENPLMTASTIINEVRREKNIVLRRQRISDVRREHGLVKKPDNLRRADARKSKRMEICARNTEAE